MKYTVIQAGVFICSVLPMNVYMILHYVLPFNNICVYSSKIQGLSSGKNKALNNIYSGNMLFQRLEAPPQKKTWDSQKVWKFSQLLHKFAPSKNIWLSFGIKTGISNLCHIDHFLFLFCFVFRKIQVWQSKNYMVFFRGCLALISGTAQYCEISIICNMIKQMVNFLISF